jgi:lipopolysaccharide export system permease protein
VVILRPLNYGKITTLKRLDLYVIGSTIKPFFGALLVTTSILILDRVFDLMDLIIKKGIPLDVVFQVMLYSLPFILSMTIPMSVFVGSLVAFGRLAQDLEILALLSSGVSLNRIAFPVAFDNPLYVLVQRQDSS